MNQCDSIRNYLEEKGSITPLEALKEFGCMRLAARIKDLERHGKQIHYTRYVKAQ